MHLGEVDDAGLRRAVRGRERLRPDACVRRDVHDVPAAVEQVRERGLAHEERAGEVDADDALPVGERHLVGVGELADTGAVHDHLRAPEVAGRARHGRLDRLGVGDVDPVGPGRPALLTDLGRGLLGAVDGDVEARDRCPLARELAGGRPPESRARARDHRDLTVESSHASEANACLLVASGCVPFPPALNRLLVCRALRLRLPDQSVGIGLCRCLETNGRRRARQNQERATARRSEPAGRRALAAPWGEGAGKRFPLASSARPWGG